MYYCVMNDVYNERHIGPIFKPIFLQINPSLSTRSIRNYLSDIRHFMGWYANTADLQRNTGGLEHLFSEETIRRYETSMQKSAISPSTARRRLGTIGLVQHHLKKSGVLTSPAMPVEQPQRPTVHKMQELEKSKTDVPPPQEDHPKPQIITEKPVIYAQNKKLGHSKGPNSDFPQIKYLFGLMGLAFLVSLFVIGFLNQSKLFRPRPYQATNTSANNSNSSLSARPILFQGIIKDALGNPLLQTKKFQFKIYAKQAGGQALYDSGTCTLQPTLEGKIRVFIGAKSDAPSTTSTCGTQIPQSLITSNTPLYLGVTVGADAEMTPRQPLANTELSTNALKVDGYGIGTGANTIPYIQNDGTITLSDPSSKILATSSEGTFTIGGSSAILLSSGFLKDIQFEATQSGNIRFKAGSYNQDQMVIAKNGNIGIRTNTPNMFQLEISGSIGPSIQGSYDLGSKARSWDTLYTNKVCFASEEYCISKNSLNGLAIETADIAEMYPTELTSTIGDVMAIGTTLIKTTSGEQIRKLVKATDAQNQHLIGVIANNTDRRIVVGHNIAQSDNPQAIALKGRIPVKIDPQSSTIEAGDYITTSSVAGRATKATKSGIMIGRALTSWEPHSGQDTVMVYIDTSYAAIDTSPWKTLAKEIQTLDLFPRSITTQKIVSPIIETEQLKANTVSSQAIYTGSIRAQTATISGTLTADTVEAKNITALVGKIEQAVEKTTSLETKTAKQASDALDTTARMNEIQASLNKLASDATTAPLSNFDPQSTSTLLTNVTVTENASVFDLSVAGTIRSLSNQLTINALSGISFMDDAVQLTQDGTVVTKGSIVAQKGIFTNSLSPIDAESNLTVELGRGRAMVIQQAQSNSPSATIASDGTAAFSSLGLSGEASPSALIDPQEMLSDFGIFVPGMNAQTASIGIGIIPDGQQSVAIFSDKLTPGAKVFLTPLTQSKNVPTVTITHTCDDTDPDSSGICKPYFLVETSQIVLEPLSFNWLIIQTQNP